MESQNSKEDYLLQVCIKAGDLQIENVRCKVYLPSKLTDQILMYFHLNQEQGRLFGDLNVWRFSIQGQVNEQVKIIADKVYSQHLTNQYWGPGISEHILIAKPVDLKVIHSLSPDPSWKDERERLSS